MKIAYLNPSLLPVVNPVGIRSMIGLVPEKPHQTDENCMAVKFAKALSELGHEVVLFTSDAFRPVESIGEKYPGLKVVYLKTILKSIFPPGYIPLTPGISSEIKRGGFDLIIATDFFQWSTILGINAASKKRIPVVVWQDLNVVPKFPGNIAIHTFHLTLGRLLQKKVDGFIGRTKSALELIEGLGVPKERIKKVVPLGVDTSVFYPIDGEEIKNRFNLGSRRIILTVARLHKDKGLDYLIPAIGLVVRKYPEVTLVIKGVGELEGEMNKLIESLSLENNVVILKEHFSVKDLNSLYGSSEFTVLASVHETFGFAVLESLACARAIVATSIPGPSDVLLNHEVGFIVKPGDSEELGRAMLKLIENPDVCQEMGRNGLLLAREEFDWKVIARKFMDEAMN